MKKLSILVAFALGIVLTACGAAATAAIPAATDVVPPAAQATATALPSSATDAQSYPVLPDVGMDAGASDMAAYPVLAGDAAMAQSKAFVDSVELRANPADPALTDIFVVGSLPNSCHQPRSVVHQPDAQNQIAIDFYSVQPTDVMCAEVLMPFQGTIASLGGYPAGTYAVLVNGQKIGDLTAK